MDELKGGGEAEALFPEGRLEDGGAGGSGKHLKSACLPPSSATRVCTGSTKQATQAAMGACPGCSYPPGLQLNVFAGVKGGDHDHETTAGHSKKAMFDARKTADRISLGDVDLDDVAHA